MVIDSSFKIFFKLIPLFRRIIILTNKNQATHLQCLIHQKTSILYRLFLLSFFYILTSINILTTFYYLFYTSFLFLFLLSTNLIFSYKNWLCFHPRHYALGVYSFDLMDFHQHHLRLCPTSYELSIQDFHLYFIIM